MSHIPYSKYVLQHKCFLFLLTFDPFFIQSDPVELLPHLYIGDAFNASSKETLERLGITAVLNVSNNCRNFFADSYRYKNIPVDDNHNADLASWFLDAINFIGMLHS